jgi:hypothetical protein
MIKSYPTVNLICVWPCIAYSEYFLEDHINIFVNPLPFISIILTICSFLGTKDITDRQFSTYWYIPETSIHKLSMIGSATSLPFHSAVLQLGQNLSGHQTWNIQALSVVCALPVSLIHPTVLTFILTITSNLSGGSHICHDPDSTVLCPTDMRHPTTGIRFEKYVIRRFRCCANTYLHKPRQYSIAYYTPRLYGISYCS